MGYSHYWNRLPEIPELTFKQAVNDISKMFKVCKKYGLSLAGWDGSGKPVISSSEVSFNGVETKNESYETFRMDRVMKPKDFEWLTQDKQGYVYQACKTGRQPYDLFVQIALIIFKHYLGRDFILSSDGFYFDWETADDLCQKHLGYGL